MWLLFLIFAICFHNIDYLDKLGNSYGIISALFSGLAALGVIYTLFQQNIFNNQQNITNLNSASLISSSNSILKETQIESAKQAKNMKIVALLNAYSTLIDFYEKRIVELDKVNSSHNSLKVYREKRKEIIEKIEEIARRKEIFDETI